MEGTAPSTYIMCNWFPNNGEKAMSQLILDWLHQEPSLTFLVVVIFTFGVVFAVLGRVLVGKNPAKMIFRASLAFGEHGSFGGAIKLAAYVSGQDLLCWGFFVGGATRYLENDWLVIAVAIPVSVGFAFLPPHTELPEECRTRSLVAIGIGGFILALLFLKSGGWHLADLWYALVCTSAAHLWVTGLIAFSFWRASRNGAATTEDTPLPP